MTNFWGCAHILLGALYLISLGLPFGWDAWGSYRRGDKRAAVFGAAFSLMATTFALHNIERGAHLITGTMAVKGVRPLDIASLILCFPVIAVFIANRVRARMGKADRMIKGAPWWIPSGIALMSFYAGAVFVRVVDFTVFYHTTYDWSRFDASYNLVLVILYLTCSFMWLRFQTKARLLGGSWSLSGLTFGVMFFSIAMTHFSQAIIVSSGYYVVTPGRAAGVLWVDIFSILAAMLFLGVAFVLLATVRSITSNSPLPKVVEDIID